MRNVLMTAGAETALSGISVGALSGAVLMIQASKLVEGAVLAVIGFGLLYFKYKMQGK